MGEDIIIVFVIYSRVFADNPGKVLSEFSGQFLKAFLSTLSHRHGTKRVLANTVYQELV